MGRVSNPLVRTRRTKDLGADAATASTTKDRLTLLMAVMGVELIGLSGAVLPVYPSTENVESADGT